MKRLKVGIAARWNPQDKRAWSGTPYFSYGQVCNHFDTELFYFNWNWLLRERLGFQKSINRKWFGKNTAVEYLKPFAKYFSKRLEHELKRRPVDLLLVPSSPQLLAYLNTDIPVVYMTDATFHQLQGYYPYFSNLAGYNIREGVDLDKNAFQKAAHIMLASEWSRRSAISEYGTDPEKISVVPLGANLVHIPSEESLLWEPSGQLRLLFLGVEWERKGGNIVLDCYRILKEKGANPHLYIIGCVPPAEVAAIGGVTIIPFLDKNNEQDCHKLDQIFRETDFLLLPTRAECAGVVFSEASSYGIPSITTDTGGVSTYVQDGVNGYTLPLSAGGSDYAEKISTVYSDKKGLLDLKHSARNYYNEFLNWDQWGSQFQQIAERLIRKK